MPRILLIEDEEMVRDALRELLESADYEVVEAEHGKRAVEVLKSESIDLVVTDIFMPEMDGIELIQHIRGAHPEMRVIAISGGGARQNPDYATRLASQIGADHIMQKPVDSDDFMAQVKRLT